MQERQKRRKEKKEKKIGMQASKEARIKMMTTDTVAVAKITPFEHL